MTANSSPRPAIVSHPFEVPAVYQLLGFPGTGKYTVAKAIVERLQARGEPAALLDNHATIDPKEHSMSGRSALI